MLSEIQLGSSLIIASFFAITAIIVDAIFKKNKNIAYFYTLFGFLITTVVSFITLLNVQGMVVPINSNELYSKGMLIFGGYTSYFDTLFSLAALLTMFAAKNFLKREYFEYNEFYSLLLFAVVGMMLIVHSNSLLILFLGIELMSISFYVLAGFIRTNTKSVEASLKYFLLGAFATGFLLYGIALIYGATGTLNIIDIGKIVMSKSDLPIYCVIGLGLIIIGLSFKSAAFPFHQWAPDVYHGSPTVVTGFMSTAGKTAAIIALVVITRPFMANILDVKSGFDISTIQNIIAFISAGTMLIGNITALVQKNIKRMLAYSSVAHAGYLLMGIVANSTLGWVGITFYATAYLFMQMGAFTIISVYERNNEKNLEIKDYAGLSKSHPAMAAMMALFMFSLAGIPPMAGFFGKYYLFAATVEAGFTWLTIVAVISSIISMYYYIGLVVQMYFKDNKGNVLEGKAGLSNITIVIATIAILLFGLFPSLILNISQTGFSLL